MNGGFKKKYRKVQFEKSSHKKYSKKQSTVTIYFTSNDFFSFVLIAATPRNIGNGPAQPLIWQDFRLKGFPDKSFHAPKIPKYKRMSVDLMNTDKDDQYFGKTTHFDTGKKIYITV